MSTQAEWDVYADNITDGWDLCANCTRDATGKKLFRQYNFYRTLLGLPIVLSPIDNTEFQSPSGMFLEWVPPNPGPEMILMTPGAWSHFGWGFYQCGQALGNPRVRVTQTDDTQQLLPSAPGYQLLLATLPAGGLLACTCTDNGAPGTIAPVFWV